MIAQVAAVEWRSPPEARPHTVHRDQLLDLIERIAPALPTPLSDGALRLLRVMAKLTPPRAWAEPDADPCCYMQQAELCQVTGRAAATVRRHERELLAAGLIDKRTAANGARSGFLGCGIFFGRMIHRLAEFRALDARLSAEREEHAHLRGQRSIHKRHLRAALAALAEAGHPAAPAITAQLQNWPGAEQLHRMNLADLQSHVEAADTLCRRAIEIADNLEKSSGGPLIFERPYIQDTTQTLSVSCNLPVDDRSAGKPAQDLPSVAAPIGATRNKEQDNIEGIASRTSDYIARLGPTRLYQLAGEGFRMYLDARTTPGRLTFHDFVCAAQNVMRDRGINRSVWTDALRVMSEDDAMICTLITDARCSDPRAHVWNPGGFMRGMVRKAQRGELHLIGSLIGLSELRRADHERCDESKTDALGLGFKVDPPLKWSGDFDAEEV